MAWAEQSSPSVAARPPFTLSLVQALRFALQQSIAARNEELERILQGAQWTAAKSEFTPRFSLSGDSTRKWARADPQSTRTDTTDLAGSWKLPLGTQIEMRVNTGRERTLDGTSARTVTQVLQLVQPLLRGAGKAAGFALEQARLTLQVGSYQRGLAMDNVYAGVSLAYYEAVQSHQQVDLAKQALQRSRELQSINVALHQAGQMAKVELLQSDTDVAQAELALEQASNASQAADTALLRLLGPEAGQRIGDEIHLPDSPPAEDTSLPAEEAALAQALAQRSDVLLARTAVDAAKVGLAQAVDEGRPDLDLVLGTQSTAGSAVAAPSRDHTLGVRWSLPLDRSLLRLQRTQAQVGLRQAELALDDLRLQVRSEVVNALREAAFSRRQKALSDHTVELNRQKLLAETERLRAGKTSAFQMSAAQDALREASSAQTQSVLAVQRAQLQLAQATGTLAARRQVLMQGGEES